MTLLRSIAQTTTCQALLERLARAKTPLAVNGLWGSSAPALAAALFDTARRPLVYLSAHLEQADHARDDLETLLGRCPELFPAWETLPGEHGASSGADEIAAERSRLCQELREYQTGGDNEPATAPRGRPDCPVDAPLFVAPIQALLQPVPTPAALDAHSLVMRRGQSIDPERMAEWLVAHGFTRLDQVEQAGDFAWRGGIFDIFASAETDPVRLEFFGDEIESIRQFEIGTQRSMRELETTRVTRPPDAARAAHSETTSFLSYLPADAIIVLHEPLDLIETARIVLERLGHPVGHFTIEAVLKKAAAFAQVHLSRFALASVPEADTLSDTYEALPTFDAKSTDAVAQLVAMAREQKTYVFCESTGEKERLDELIAEQTSQSEESGSRDLSAATPPRIETLLGTITEGFLRRNGDLHCSQSSGTHGDSHCPGAPGSIGTSASRTLSPSIPQSLNPCSFAVVAHHELFRRYAIRRRIRKVASARPIESFIDLSEGDFVVHVVHGIGRFAGMKTMRKGDSRKSEEFLTLQFADEATMHVPITQIDLVQKYIGPKATRPPLSKLGGTRWQTTKARVEEALTDLAGELLRIQAERSASEGIAYPQDTHWQKEFEDAFPYTETPDQLSALRDLKADQIRARPMDRLLCGDVGFGKTELAIRAAFKVAEYGKQTAVLVPTTVLAEQHYRTFRERMADYPFQVECLNRFRSPRQQKQTIAAARKGQIDVLIGTHRLLSKDVNFADLGLVVVDEEQRFGVEHKERLKKLRTTVDVLTLTATPIPRTLHMSMIGLRDISSLSTPPMDRRAISTRVVPWNDQLIREAIIRELNRDGQVYFVHNRVRTIDAIAAKLAALVPEARFVVGHGQMGRGKGARDSGIKGLRDLPVVGTQDRESLSPSIPQSLNPSPLEEVMLKFIRREADVLVCTTIIEAGLDIPNANTIFIDRAERFGLADLHQLRGRVGRYKHRAYCYLMLSPDRPMTDAAARRLKAIEEFSDLGAGFRIAMRDLEIRGAGNMLGPEQSGQIAAVGYELYCQLLEKTVKRMRGETGAATDERAAVHLELDVEAYIPSAYIPSDRQRMECYRRFSACRTPEDVEELTRDLRDAFGPYPSTVDTLLSLSEIRVRAAKAGIHTIIRKEPDVIFRFDGDVRKLEPYFTRASGKVSLPDAKTLHWRLPDHYFHGETLLTILRNLFRQESTELAEPGAKVERPRPGQLAGGSPARPAAGTRRTGPATATPNVLPRDAPPRKRRRPRRTHE